MTDREQRLIAVIRNLMEPRRKECNVCQKEGCACGWCECDARNEARAILAELDPQPRELWGGGPMVVELESGPWRLFRIGPRIGDNLEVCATTREQAIRRYNACVDAIEKLEAGQ